MLALSAVSVVVRPNDAVGAHARARAPAMAAIGGSRRAAEEQKRALFEMAPWEEQKTLRRLDLSGFVQPFDRSGVVLAGVFANQEGLRGVGRQEPWRCIGIVAAEDTASLPLAVARQRPLIEAWAYELVRDYSSGSRLMRRGPFAPPIRLAWAPPPDFWKKAMMPSSRGLTFNEVPADTPVTGVRCGFLGTQSREVKGARGGFRFVGVELPG